MGDKIIGYSLSPIVPAMGQMMTAAVRTCFVSGRVISSMGGGSAALHPDVVDILQNDEEVRELIQRKMAERNTVHPIG